MTVSIFSNKIGILLAVMIFGLTYGLSAPLIAIRLVNEGYSEIFVGINAAMHAVGVFIVAPFLPVLCRRFHAKTLIIFSLFISCLVLCLFPLTSFATWFVLRLMLGAMSEIMLVVTETWLNFMAEEASRARIIAAYTASLSTGFALGPLILVSVGSSGNTAFYLGAAIALLAAVVVTRSAVRPFPAGEQHQSKPVLMYLSLAPIAIAATVLNAGLESAGLNLLSVYAMNLGWDEQSATSLISVLLIGAILLQLPIGWVADKYNRQWLIVIMAGLSACGALLWPISLNYPWMAYTLLFVWGGVFVGIYTVVVTLVGERFSNGELVGVYAVLSIAWGVGALVGPMMGGVAMELNTHGLPLMAALLCGLFMLFTLKNARRGC
ncbi:MFS transporter [Serratia marcescens]|uniref:MFS transporter n=1 Tax=Serratia marcescens TaxID=615 RepID=UPI0011578F1C|nr:MFS transporter [Serratia marcescens]